jgi:23S rRNA pseudouridine2605 synthase
MGALTALGTGLVEKGAKERFRPMGVTVDRQLGDSHWLKLTLTEGKNREIRRAMR